MRKARWGRFPKTRSTASRRRERPPEVRPAQLEQEEKLPDAAQAFLFSGFALAAGVLAARQPAWSWKIYAAIAGYVASGYLIQGIDTGHSWLAHRAWRNYDPPPFPAWKSVWMPYSLHAAVASCLIMVLTKRPELLLVYLILASLDLRFIGNRLCKEALRSLVVGMVLGSTGGAALAWLCR